MASYQVRHRDPLLNAQMQAALTRRGREALGLLLLLLAAAAAAMLASYQPDDASWLAATDAPAQNWLGRTGASIATPLIIVIGLAAWGLVPLFLVWALRFLLHRGSERAPSRLIFAPIALALAAVYASTLTPPAGWPHSFGLGGLFGDTVLGAVLGVAPVTASFGLRIVSLVVAAGLVALAAHVLGLDRRELRLLARFLLLGAVALYAALRWLAVLILRLALRGGRAGAQAGRAAWDARRRARAERAAAAESIGRGDGAPAGTAPARPAPGAVPRRDPRPEPVLSAALAPKLAPRVEPPLARAAAPTRPAPLPTEPAPLAERAEVMQRAVRIHRPLAPPPPAPTPAATAPLAASAGPTGAPAPGAAAAWTGAPTVTLGAASPAAARRGPGAEPPAGAPPPEARAAAPAGGEARGAGFLTRVPPVLRRPGGAADPRRADTPWADTPWADTPWAETPWAETPWAEPPRAEPPRAETPRAETPPGGARAPSPAAVRGTAFGADPGDPVLDPPGESPGGSPGADIPPELVEPMPPAHAETAAGLAAAGREERLRAKIADQIRLRAVRGARGEPAARPAPPARREPPLLRDRRPRPLMLNPARAAAPALQALGAMARSVFGVRLPGAEGAPAARPEATLTAEPRANPDRTTAPAASAPAGPVAAGTAAEAAQAAARLPGPEAADDGPDLPPAFRPPLAPERGPGPGPVVQHLRRAAPPSRQAQAEAQPRLRLEEAPAAYEPPPLALLANPAGQVRPQLSDAALAENARMLMTVLDDYGVRGEIVSVRPGPVVTLYELEPAPGLKASRVIGLADDIARSMSALSARVSTVPGRSVIGIELPNAQREKVLLREILASRDFGDSQLRLPLALGKDIAGAPVVANLAKMPHLLIAGTTGSGKSVAINTMILSLLYRLSPAECRLIMIDPKMLELSVYDGIPHLLAPVVTDPKKAVVALKWVVSEMEDRYRKMSKLGVRNIEGYNGRVREALARGEMFRRTIQTGFDEETGDPLFETEEFEPKALPYIVVIVDEMADLMMVAGKEIEACIQRLAQMARASGIHLIMATQRPSVDVITGTIKANFPTRISFQVTSRIDSRTILGEMGAEQLLGQGDMLYMAGGARITRVHGPFVSDEEVEEIVTHLKSQGPPAYVAGVLEDPEETREGEIEAALGLGGEGSDAALYDQAVAIVARDRKCSTSYIQRKLGIGYNKAARLVEQMEAEGVVSPANHVGKREVLIEER